MTEQAPPAPTAPRAATRPAPARPKRRRLPLWRVLLHNDDVNDMGYVVESIVALTPISSTLAVVKMLEAHRTGVSLLLTTHREHAELIEEQFRGRQLTITIEPDE